METVGAVEVGKPVKSDVTAAMQGCALHPTRPSFGVCGACDRRMNLGLWTNAG